MPPSDRRVRPPVDIYQSAPLRVSDPAGRSHFRGEEGLDKGRADLTARECRS
jgi:hypothetical protein